MGETRPVGRRRQLQLGALGAVLALGASLLAACGETQAVEVEPAATKEPQMAATVGDTLTTAAGLDITLARVDRLREIEQVRTHGGPVRPRDGSFLLVTIEYRNRGSGMVSVARDRTTLITADDAKITVDPRGINALLTRPVQPYQGRPLVLAESVLPGQRTQAAVVFDGLPDCKACASRSRAWCSRFPTNFPRAGASPPEGPCPHRTARSVRSGPRPRTRPRLLAT